MYIKVRSRRGRFNWAHPSAESISTHLSVYDGDKILCFTNITTDTEYESEHSFDYESVAKDLSLLIDEQKKKVLYSTAAQEWEAFQTFLKEHDRELSLGQAEHYRLHLLRLRATCEERLKQLNGQIGSAEGYIAEALEAT